MPVPVGCTVGFDVDFRRCDPSSAAAEDYVVFRHRTIVGGDCGVDGLSC